MRKHLPTVLVSMTCKVEQPHALLWRWKRRHIALTPHALHVYASSFDYNEGRDVLAAVQLVGVTSPKPEPVPDPYVSFTEKEGHVWTLRFDNDSDKIDFLKHWRSALENVYRTPSQVPTSHTFGEFPGTRQDRAQSEGHPTAPPSRDIRATTIAGPSPKAPSCTPPHSDGPGPDFAYGPQMEELRGMGFPDDCANAVALNATHGDVPSAVSLLLQTPGV